MIIDFVKNAGEQVWDRLTGEDADREKAEKISGFVENMGLNVKGLQVNVDDDVVTIQGVTQTQAEREKVILAAGNIEGVAKVNDKIKVIPGRNGESVVASREEKKEGREPRFYTVKKGDTLSEIALDYYGDAQKYPKIFEANTPMLKDPDKIYPGQTLRIPH